MKKKCRVNAINEWMRRVSPLVHEGINGWVKQERMNALGCTIGRMGEKHLVSHTNDGIRVVIKRDNNTSKNVPCDLDALSQLICC